MRLLRRLGLTVTTPVPHGPTSAGGLADLALVVPGESAASLRREAVVLYLVPLVLLGSAGALHLVRRREDEALLMLFVVSALAVAGAIAAWLKQWRAGLGWRGTAAVLTGLALLVAPWCTMQHLPLRTDAYRGNFSELFWGLCTLFVATVLFTVGREVGQRVRPALLTLPMALVYIEHTPHRAHRWNHYAMCQFGHDLDAVALDLVAFGLCVAYVAYVARVLPEKVQPTRLPPEPA